MMGGGDDNGGQQQGQGDDKVENERMATAAVGMTRKREGEGERCRDHGDNDDEQVRGEKKGGRDDTTPPPQPHEQLLMGWIVGGMTTWRGMMWRPQ
jgi:hypothetical protein